jgi:cytochrome P450
LGKYALALLSKNPHKMARRLIIQGFTPRYITPHVDIVRAIERYFPQLESTVKSSLLRWTQLGDFLIYPEIKKLAFELAVVLLLGFKMEDNTTQEILKQMNIWIAGIVSLLPYEIPFTTFAKSMGARRKLMKIFEQKILELKERPSDGIHWIGYH